MKLKGVGRRVSRLVRQSIALKFGIVLFFVSQAAGTLLSENLPLGLAFLMAQKISGLKEKDLQVDEASYSSSLFGRTARIQQRSRQQKTRTLIASFKKRLQFLPWRLSDIRDDG